MTMRQVHALLKIIDRADLVEFYNTTLSYAAAGRAKKLPSLEEFLALASNETPKEQNVFDEKTDKVLEEQAKRRLEEMRARHTGVKPDGR